MFKKRCYACGKTKFLDEYYKCNTRYRQRECKDCCRERKYAWYKTEKGKRSSANTKLKRRFGITLSEYENLLGIVNNRCQICGATESVNSHRLGVDHDHKTGAIKGILCKACNSGIGYFQDNIDSLKAAVKYLEDFNRSGGVIY